MPKKKKLFVSDRYQIVFKDDKGRFAKPDGRKKLRMMIIDRKGDLRIDLGFGKFPIKKVRNIGKILDNVVGNLIDRKWKTLLGKEPEFKFKKVRIPKINESKIEKSFAGAKQRLRDQKEGLITDEFKENIADDEIIEIGLIYLKFAFKFKYEFALFGYVVKFWKTGERSSFASFFTPEFLLTNLDDIAPIVESELKNISLQIQDFFSLLDGSDINYSITFIARLTKKAARKGE